MKTTKRKQKPKRISLPPYKFKVGQPVTYIGRGQEIPCVVMVRYRYNDFATYVVQVETGIIRCQFEASHDVNPKTIWQGSTLPVSESLLMAR